MMFQKVRMEMSSSVKRMVLHGESKLKKMKLMMQTH